MYGCSDPPSERGYETERNSESAGDEPGRYMAC